MELPSKILQNAVDQLATLPGVGKRSALRYALHLLNNDEIAVRDLSESLLRLKTDLHHCRVTNQPCGAWRAIACR